MTRARVSHGAAGWDFSAEGHASGEPAACAGVSALLCALGLWLETRPAGVEVLELSLAPGRARVRFRGGDAAGALVAQGLRGVARAYPGAVRVEEGGSQEVGFLPF